MRTITKTYNVYSFDELSDEAKDRALNTLWDINVDHEWWSYLFEDAKYIGLDISEFNFYPYRYLKGSFSDDDPEMLAAKILDIYRPYHPLTELAMNWQHRLETEPDTITDQCIEDFFNNIKNEFFTILCNEYDYLTSREAIIETIKANEYEFLESGDLT